MRLCAHRHKRARTCAHTLTPRLDTGSACTRAHTATEVNVIFGRLITRPMPRECRPCIVQVTSARLRGAANFHPHLPTP
eukprot:6207119-Pleurochrysis_carterae.AAC.2